MESLNNAGSTSDEVEIMQIKQGIWRTYDGADGLHPWVSCILQDRQGYLWLGTKNGLRRYDGERFITYTAHDGLVSDFVRSICEDSQGRLWFGERWGGGVSCYDGQQFINYTTEDGLAYKTVLEAYRDRQQRLWHGSNSGLYCFDSDGLTTYTTADGLLDNRVHDILQDREGNFWFIHYHSGMTRFDPETIRLLTTATVTEALIQTSEGVLWFGDTNKLCCLYKGKQRCYTLDSTVWSVMEDSSKRLWVGTIGHGLYCYDSTDAVWEGKPKHFTKEEGLGSNSAVSVMEARDGTIWVGTAGSPGCLCRF